MNLDPQVFSGAGIVMLIGMGIVFIALIVIICLLVIMSKIFRSAVKTPAKKEEAPVPAPAPAPAPAAAAPQEDEEIAAVLAAAVALLSEEGDGRLRVRSIRRVGASSPAWSLSGRQEYVGTRY